MSKRPFIIDCDTGTDDAIAILAAYGCPDMDILAITSVNGNVAEKSFTLDFYGSVRTGDG